MKKNLFFVLCALLSLSFASCSHGNDIKEVSGTWTAEGGDVSIKMTQYDDWDDYTYTYTFKGTATYTVTFDDENFTVKSKIKGTGNDKGTDKTITGKGTFKLEEGVLKFKLKKLTEDNDDQDVDETFTYKYEYVDKTSFTVVAKSDDDHKVFYGCDSKLTFTKE